MLLAGTILIGIRHPLASIILASALFIDWQVTHPNFMRRGCYHGPHFAVYRDQFGIRIDEDSGSPPMHLVPHLRSTCRGLWATTSVRHVHQMYTDTEDPNFALTAQERDDVRAQFISATADMYGNYLPFTLLKSGEGATSVPVLSGYLHNAAALGTAALLVLSMGWITDARRAQRAARARRNDQCPNCRYDLRGLANNTCPECGHSDATRKREDLESPERE